MQKNPKNYIKYAIIAIAVCMIVVFALAKGIQRAAAVSSILLFVLIVVFGLIRAYKYIFPVEENTGIIRPSIPVICINSDECKQSRKRAWLIISGMIIVVKLITYIGGYFFAKYCGTVSGGFFEAFDDLWCYSGIDAPSYLGIAENWYVTAGDPKYHIVFFPLYPILIRLFYYIFRNYLVAAIAVSTLASVGIGIAGYELARLDLTDRQSKRFVAVMILMPGAFFYSTAMTEALFVFLSIMCILFARKKQFLLAGIFGALAAFTRSPGILLAVPVGIEWLHTVINEKPKPLKSIAKGLCVSMISLGLIAYLFVNKAVWGNAFQFLVFQKEHWSQQLGLFYETIDSITQLFIDSVKNCIETNAALNSWDTKLAFGLYFAQLAAIFGSLFVILFCVNRKKMHVTYTAYFAVYFAVTIGATWLLSAPRYLMANVGLSYAITLIVGENKLRSSLFMAGLLIASIAYLMCYISYAPIY